MGTLTVEYDGNVIVPCSPVPANFRPRIKARILLPQPKLIPEEQAAWGRIEAEIAKSEPHFSSVDDALDYTWRRS